MLNGDHVVAARAPLALEGNGRVVSILRKVPVIQIRDRAAGRGSNIDLTIAGRAYFVIADELERISRIDGGGVLNGIQFVDQVFRGTLRILAKRNGHTVGVTPRPAILQRSDIHQQTVTGRPGRIDRAAIVIVVEIGAMPDDAETAEVQADLGDLQGAADALGIDEGP